MELRGTPPILQVHGTPRTIHGIPWHYMELCGTTWHSMELHEYSMELHGIPWNSIELHEYSTDTPWTLHGGSMEFHGGISHGLFPPKYVEKIFRLSRVLNAF